MADQQKVYVEGQVVEGQPLPINAVATIEPVEDVPPHLKGLSTTFKKRLPYKTPYHTDVLYPILSLMIFNLSLYMGDRPDNKPANRDMGGSFCMCTAVGCYCHQICCKTAEEPNPTDASCVYMESKCDCQTPLKQFHQLHNQCYCFDVRYALPGSLLPAFNDSEHPAICNLLGFTFGYIAPGKGCVMVNAFGKSIGEIRKLAHEKQ